MGAMALFQETSTVQVLTGGAFQETLKVSTQKGVVDGPIEVQPLSMEEALPIHVLTDIFNKVNDARDLANCMATSRTMNEAVQQVPSLTLICKKRYYDLSRARFPIRRPCSFSDDDEEEDDDAVTDEDGPASIDSEDSDDSEAEDDDETCEWSSAPIAPAPPEDAVAALPQSSSSPSPSPPSKQVQPVYISFKSACLNMLRHVNQVEQLRIEVDQEMQANLFQKEEIHMVDFWLSEPTFVRKWVSMCRHTLLSLTIVDYGQQAIMRQSPIVRVLSETCKELRHLELRNMYLDTNNLQLLPRVHSLTLRCIKLTPHSLPDLLLCMPSLLTLALVSVFGVQEARLASPHLQVLCLGLSTPATTVDLDLPLCTKLQLKMTCPDVLRVRAPNLASVAVCMEKRDGAVVEFHDVRHLRELLFGASHFSTLSQLLRTNLHLEKVFLDVPCMALGEDGKWEGVVPLNNPRSSILPDMEALKSSCPVLHTLSVGPGLWHSMEEAFMAKGERRKGELLLLETFRGWTGLKTLIVHLVVQSLETCVAMVKGVRKALPALKAMEIYVHLDSPVHLQRFWKVCQGELNMPNVQWGTWKRSLNFACFSF